MYTHVWSKYLPIIRILAKRATTGDQMLAMNATDFQRAGAGRKVSYKFSLQFSNGRLETMTTVSTSPVAKDLLVVLMQDDLIKGLFKQNTYQVEMNPKFQLAIKAILKTDAGEEHAVNDEIIVQAVA